MLKHSLSIGIGLTALLMFTSVADAQTKKSSQDTSTTSSEHASFWAEYKDCFGKLFPMGLTRTTLMHARYENQLAARKFCLRWMSESSYPSEDELDEAEQPILDRTAKRIGYRPVAD